MAPSKLSHSLVSVRGENLTGESNVCGVWDSVFRFILSEDRYFDQSVGNCCRVEKNVGIVVSYHTFLRSHLGWTILSPYACTFTVHKV